METIICAAIWYDDGYMHPNQECYGIGTGFVIGGFRHCNIIGVLPVSNNFRHTLGLCYDDRDFNCTEGFITSLGRFVDRKEAQKIAYNAGQITDKLGSNLFSEDIY